MKNPGWAWQLWCVVFVIAGVAIVVTALVGAGGDLLANITVRGGTVPALLVVTVGALLGAGGVAGFLWQRRNE